MSPVSDVASALSRGLADTVWGRRGLVKTNSLWLPLAVLLSLRAGSLPDTAGCLYLGGAAACWAAGSILVNDIADSRDDCSAGKHRWIVELPAPAGLLLVILVWALGASFVVGLGNVATPAVYGGSVVLSLLYSVEPFRLKGRRLWGLLCYSLACASAYAGMPWTFLNGGVLGLAVLAPAVFLDKWVNLYFHQVLDIEADLDCNVSTYAVAVGREQARRELMFFARLASAAMIVAFACAVYLMPSHRWFVASAGIAAVAATGVFARTRRRANGSSLVQELPAHYLGLTYGVFRATPAAVFLCLACSHRSLAPLAAVVWALIAWETVLLFLYRRP